MITKKVLIGQQWRQLYSLLLAQMHGYQVNTITGSEAIIIPLDRCIVQWAKENI